MEELFENLKNYALTLPTGVVAVIVLILGLWLGKKVLKLVGFLLIAAAILFYVLQM